MVANKDHDIVDRGAERTCHDNRSYNIRCACAILYSRYCACVRVIGKPTVRGSALKCTTGGVAHARSMLSFALVNICELSLASPRTHVRIRKYGLVHETRTRTAAAVYITIPCVTVKMGAVRAVYVSAVGNAVLTARRVTCENG